MPEIFSTMQQEYEDRLKNDKKLGQIRKQIKAGATYSEAEAYAARSGEILSGVMKNNIDADVFANEDLNELVVPMMRANYEKVVSATSAVQSTLNQAANIGIKPIVPEFDEGAAFNLVDKMRSYDSFEEAEWLLGEPVVTNSMKCVDEMLHENADFQFRSGMSPKIVRTAETDCCDWCASLEGVYEYSELSNTDDVWKRHANCKCEITFVPSEGKAQDAWSKKYMGDAETKRIKDRINGNNLPTVRGFANGPRRSPFIALSSEEIEEIKNEAETIGIPTSVLRFNEGEKTGYSDYKNVIYVRGDVFPSEYAINPNSIISSRAALAHEYYGHYLHHDEFPPGSWEDEYWASRYAALNAPNLSDEERRLLMIDAYERASSAGVVLKYDQEARRIVYGTDKKRN